MQVGEKFELITAGVWHECMVVRVEEDPLVELNPMVLASQRDFRWRYNQLGASAETIGSAGCAFMCAYAIATSIDSSLTPSVLCERLSSSYGFTNKGELIWEVLPQVVTASGSAMGATLEFLGPADRSKDGDLIWRGIPANMERVFSEIGQAPTIMQVDFVPGGSLDTHFVLALEYDEVQKDLLVYDPWDGVPTYLMMRYAQDHWDLARAIYGLRLIRVMYDGAVLRPPYY